MLLNDISSIQSAINAYNGFHDAIMESCEIVSGDRHVAWGTQELERYLSLQLRFSHYNYSATGQTTILKIIGLRLTEVADLVISFKHEAESASGTIVNYIELVPAFGKGSDEVRMGLAFFQNVNDPKAGWRVVNFLNCTFAGAEFQEIGMREFVGA